MPNKVKNREEKKTMPEPKLYLIIFKPLEREARQAWSRKDCKRLAPPSPRRKKKSPETSGSPLSGLTTENL